MVVCPVVRLEGRIREHETDRTLVRMNRGDDGDLVDATTVRRAVLRVARRSRLEQPAGGPTSTALSVLAHLSRVDRLTPGAIAARERLQPQSLTRTLAALQQAGLLERGTDPLDHRRQVLTITRAGRAAVGADMRARDTWLAEAMARELTDEERGALVAAAELLERLAVD